MIDMYNCYEDFVQKKIVKTCSMLKEARAWRKAYPKHSEVWIEKIDADGNSKEVH
jgi:hypothetical protein